MTQYTLNSYVSELHINNSYAYKTRSTNLEIYNLTDPLNISLVKTVPMDFTGYEVYSHGDLVFVENRPISGQEYINIYNVTNKKNPINTANFTIPYGLGKLNGKGDSLYVSVLNYGLYVYNISDPYNPSTSGTINSDHTSQPIKIIGNKMHYTTSGFSSQYYHIYDISNSSGPELLNTTSYNYYGGRSGATNGSYVWMGFGVYGVRAFSVNQTYSITHLSHLNWYSDSFLEVEAFQNYLLILSQYDGLLLVNRTSLTLLDIYKPDKGIDHMSVDRDEENIFVVSTTLLSSLGIVDNQFEIRQTIDMVVDGRSDADNLFLYNNTLYLERFDDLGIEVWNATDPYNLTKIGHISVWSSFEILWAYNESIVITGEYSEINIYKLHKNGTGENLLTINPGDGIDDILTFNNTMYIAIDEFVHVYNMTDFTQLYKIQTFDGDTTRRIKRMKVYDSKLFILRYDIVERYSLFNNTYPTQEISFDTDFDNGNVDISAINNSIYLARGNELQEFRSDKTTSSSNTSSSSPVKPPNNNQDSSTTSSTSSSSNSDSTSTSSTSSTQNTTPSTTQDTSSTATPSKESSTSVGLEFHLMQVMIVSVILLEFLKRYRKYRYK